MATFVCLGHSCLSCLQLSVLTTVICSGRSCLPWPQLSGLATVVCPDYNCLSWPHMSILAVVYSGHSHVSSCPGDSFLPSPQLSVLLFWSQLSALATVVCPSGAFVPRLPLTHKLCCLVTIVYPRVDSLPPFDELASD
ncbi:hypothetical protein BaRGS_00015740 [Batillaria attramentaria]|uniref:Secreted protein n=1 Tax=Batillaria attramentaria TaxID=370345 RepID=A0ABD0L0N9_9CAEN